MRYEVNNYNFCIYSNSIFSQCLNNAVDAAFQNDTAIIGVDEVVYISTGDLWVQFGANQGDKFLLYKNNILMPSGLNYFALADEVKIIPNSIGVATISITSDESGCNNWNENNTVIQQVLPILWLTKPIAQPKNNKTQISWSVASQISNQKFIIEHSNDGRKFSPIGEIAGDGTNNETKQYTYIHETPSIGINYYRIKQVDYDGKYSYSDITSVRYDGADETNIYPNPTTSEVTITTSKQASLQHMDVYGRVVSNQTLSEGQNTINLSELPKGILIFVIGDQRYKVLKE